MEKTKNVGFSQTFIVLFWIIYLEKKIFKDKSGEVSQESIEIYLNSST